MRTMLIASAVIVLMGAGAAYLAADFVRIEPKRALAKETRPLHSLMLTPAANLQIAEHGNAH